ncbi:hypothetical protein EGQ50_02450 [Coxiella endosymbiont of Amblyomma sculptum]|nr:hypothetical protein EGQ50_02450 [Coxiella endosymbiont of Amblyomma sculptum]
MLEVKTNIVPFLLKHINTLSKLKISKPIISRQFDSKTKNWPIKKNHNIFLRKDRGTQQPV